MFTLFNLLQYLNTSLFKSYSYFFQEIGVIGAYATAISVVIISVCITVFTTKENPGKEVKEPVGKYELIVYM